MHMTLINSILHSWDSAYQRNETIIKSFSKLFVLWFSIRIISGLFLSVVSGLRPITDLEQQIALLPPSQPFMDWLTRTFLSPWLRWDAVWFVRIVSQGYHATDGTALFHPLYPVLARPLFLLNLNAIFSLLIVSAVACIGLLISFQYLANLDIKSSQAQFGILLLLSAPPAFVLFAPYTEGLFLFLAILCFLFAHKKLWWLAGIAGGLASLTRQQGTLLLIPVAWEMWESVGYSFKQAIKHWKLLFPLTLIPGGYLIWIIYRALILNDVHLNLSNPISSLSSLLLSPSGTKVVPIHGITWPWTAIQMAVQKLILQPDLDIWINVILGIGFLVLLGISWKRMKWSYRLYVLAITILSFSFNTGTVHPYMGLPRHLLLAFPVFIGAASAFDTPWKRLTIIALSSGGWFVLLSLYGLQAWIP